MWSRRGTKPNCTKNLTDSATFVEPISVATRRGTQLAGFQHMAEGARHWKVVLELVARRRISVRVETPTQPVLVDCHTPEATMDVLAGLLARFRSNCDELTAAARAVGGAWSCWSTTSSGSALYWCASMLGKIWPPARVPLFERRARDAQPCADPPLIERRTL
jgi:hypothetical protein